MMQMQRRRVSPNVAAPQMRQVVKQTGASPSAQGTATTNTQNSTTPMGEPNKPSMPSMTDMLQLSKMKEELMGKQAAADGGSRLMSSINNAPNPWIGPGMMDMPGAGWTDPAQLTGASFEQPGGIFGQGWDALTGNVGYSNANIFTPAEMMMEGAGMGGTEVAPGMMLNQNSLTFAAPEMMGGYGADMAGFGAGLNAGMEGGMGVFGPGMAAAEAPVIGGLATGAEMAGAGAALSPALAPSVGGMAAEMAALAPAAETGLLGALGPAGLAIGGVGLLGSLFDWW